MSIGLSLSLDTNKMKFLNIDNFSYLWKFEPDIPNSFGEILFEKPQNLQKKCMSSLTFCHPVILQFLFAFIFFVTDCKELEVD